MEIFLPEKMVFKLRRDLIIRDKQGVYDTSWYTSQQPK